MKYHYRNAMSPDEERAWLCAECRHAKQEQIMAEGWRLVGVSTDSSIHCCACDNKRQSGNSSAVFAKFRTFLLALH